ncbi:hypothetical protein DL95DRAFT_498590 [Leptodontidium sp. 2 PMI_412]|nr:hypothetical protein DL95DRAFT_498590 [Leptodontidium sp. 2 PMI_412]
MQLHSTALVQPPSLATQFRCCDCERDFKSEGALTDHLRFSRVHKPGKGGKNKKNKKKQHGQQEQSTPQMTCEKCSRTFTKRDALSSHLSSVRHHPLSDIKCLADTKCEKRFNCPSGQLQHLESGKCTSRMTKTKLFGAIATKDTRRIITSRGFEVQTLLEDNLSASASSTSQTLSPVLTPTSTEFLGSYPPSPPSLPESTLSLSANFHYILPHRLHTQSGFQVCHLCPPSRTRTFKGKAALQQHLSSSVHAQVSTSLPVLDDISFHCPRTLLGDGSQTRPSKQFSTVSGLVQHLESGACNGGKGTLRRVIEYVEDEMKGMGFRGLKLLS